MGLWKNLRAVLAHPDIMDELEKEKAARQELDSTLAATEHELELAEDDAGILRQTLDRTANHLDACRAALQVLCAESPSNEKLLQIYETVSPSMDPRGFALFHTAEKLTGIDVSSFFSYEDNRGLFAQMDGRQLLRWVTAAHFQAVKWTAVPGTVYEAAALLEVDTSTPEYRVFERQLYGKTLERMGFQDILAPGLVLKLYSRLSGKLVMPGYAEPQLLDGSDLVEFQAVILHGLEDERKLGEEEQGFMASFDGSDAVNEKVVSVFPTVEEVDGELYGVAVCHIIGALNADELAELKDHCRCQYNDSWGESFSERPRRTRWGELHVSFYTDNSFSILTKEEMDAGRVPIRFPHKSKEDRGEHSER